MFQNAQSLDKNKHGALRFQPASDFAFARGLTTAPLAPIEIAEAAEFYPVLFTPNGLLNAVAVLGLRERNVFLNEKNQWLDTYVPVHVRRYPFILGRVGNTDEYLLAADMDAPQFNATEGEQVFSDNSELNPYFDKVVELLNTYEKNLREGRVVLNELETSGVLVSKDLSFREGHDVHLIGGFRVVEREKVMALDDATLARWVRNGLMALLELHWASFRHLAKVALASSRPDQVQ
ncbi:SapC family protein [Undibacterium sp. TJN19]|uniref:SapC family protein n=1 Tax=Undibacterium sp. TJN19 TaxID=3413055 RepID=UPI003BF125E5